MVLDEVFEGGWGSCCVSRGAPGGLKAPLTFFFSTWVISRGSTLQFSCTHIRSSGLFKDQRYHIIFSGNYTTIVKCDNGYLIDCQRFDATAMVPIVMSAARSAQGMRSHTKHEVGYYNILLN